MLVVWLFVEDINKDYVLIFHTMDCPLTTLDLFHYVSGNVTHPVVDILAAFDVGIQVACDP